MTSWVYTHLGMCTREPGSVCSPQRGKALAAAASCGCSRRPALGRGLGSRPGPVQGSFAQSVRGSLVQCVVLPRVRGRGRWQRGAGTCPGSPGREAVSAGIPAGIVPVWPEWGLRWGVSMPEGQPAPAHGSTFGPWEQGVLRSPSGPFWLWTLGWSEAVPHAQRVLEHRALGCTSGPVTGAVSISETQGAAASPAASEL